MKSTSDELLEPADPVTKNSLNNNKKKKVTYNFYKHKSFLHTNSHLWMHKHKNFILVSEVTKPSSHIHSLINM